MAKIKMTAPFPTLKTERFLLRQIRADDIDNIYRGLSNPEVIKYYGVNFDSLQATEEQMLWFENLEKTKTGIWWAICSLDGKTFYGAGGFNALSATHKKAEIGFWLLPDYWKQGIMREVFPVLCNYGFDKLGLNRIEGMVETENKNCKNAIEKMNFVLEGTMRECEIKDGQYLSIDMYSLLKKDRKFPS